MINAQEVKSLIAELIDDPAEFVFYEEGQPVSTTVGKAAREAIIKMEKDHDEKQQ
jgi:hypothetical protein